MPIPIDQFEKGLDTDDNKIIEFLETNPDKAYTIEEIAHAIGMSLMGDAVSIVLGGIAARVQLSNRLTQLNNKRRIRSQLVGGNTYYAAISRGK